MGQSSSTQRDQRHDTHPERILSFHAARSRFSRHADMNNEQNIEQTGEGGPHSGPEINNGDFDILSQQWRSMDSWQRWISSRREQAAASRQMGSIQEENGTQYQSNQREYRNASFSRMHPRRPSAMSRLGSRLLPNAVIRGLLSSEEETPAEGHAHRYGGMVSRTVPRTEVPHSNRFSPFSSLGSRGITRRRSIRGPYFIPRNDPGLNTDTTDASAYFDHNAEHVPETTRGSWRRSARLHRVRHSLSSPITHMFGQPSTTMSDQPTGNIQQPSLDSVPSESPGTFLPYPAPMDTRMDFEEPHELDSVEPAVGSNRPTSPSSSQSAQAPSSLRQFPGLLRARQSRALRREEQTPLSRVLQLAAAAIAAQLSGTAGPVMPNIQALGNDGLDGSLENFIHSLQNATSAQTSPNDAPNPPGDNGPATPVNFLRVFRFANSDTPRPSGTPGRPAAESDNSGTNPDGMDVEPPVDGPEGRTVTLVVVGVRSVPSGNGPSSDQPANGTPGLDALLRLPFLSGQRNPESGPTFPPRTEGRPRYTPSRHQTGGPSLLSPPEDASQQPGVPSPRRFSDTASRGPLSSVPVLSESPPGPHPPPSTPAEPGLSAVSSGASTPSRRPSVASMMSPSALPQLNENRSMQPTVETEEGGIPLNTSRQRRRSDSEYARHRDLGSGAVRRNGVVEPDNAPPPPAGRSWLIYVVGTNLSENHPAFATPSLFTDNPTYEDMILLSSLLGPVKPPVASQDDLTSAGGLFRLVEYGGSLSAEALDGAGTIQIPDGDRCLICLSDYEAAEELRQLGKCQHVFHRDCIDQWLTTGRNSCPLCRGQGVVETSNPEPTPDTQNATAA